MTKVKNSNCVQTKKKTKQIVLKLKISNCDKTQNIYFDITSNCDKTYHSNWDKTPKLNCDKTLKIKTVTKINSNCDKTQKPKL